ncbi:MAG: M28 family peptidase [Microscillaceae bacterium]|nr:M28 family peptidase [Microscillaceae bacterium]
MIRLDIHKQIACICFMLLADIVSGQNLERAKGTIDTLSAPNFHGRGYVHEGDRRTALYLEKKFQEIGLKPFNKSYYQYFALNVNTFPGKIRLKINKTTLQAGEDFLVSPISRSGQGSGKIIFLDTLIFRDMKARADFLTSKIHSKILVYSSRDFARIIELPQELIDKIYQAAALIELKDSKLVASLSNRQLSNPIFEIPRQRFDSILSLSAKPKARFKIDAELMTNYETQNLIGYIPGSTQPDSFLVVTAHYDHLGRLGKKVYFPGANDNASGIALMLELAHHYALHPPKYSMVFMAFGAEEIGLLGSKHFVEFPSFPLDNIRFLFNLDLVGTGDEGATVVNGSVFEKEFDQLLQINEQHGYLNQIKKRGLAANSDHYYFTEKGVRSFFLYTLGGIKAYHDIYDKPETLPLTRFRQVFQLLQKFLDGF